MGVDYQPVPQQEAPATTINLTDERTDEPTASPSSHEKKVEALQTTLLEVHSQMRRSSIWVYYMILVQVLVSWYFYPGLFMFLLIAAMNFFGLVGVFKRNRPLICMHFGWTIGMQCLTWFVVFYTLFYNTMYSLLALAFCLVHIMGLKHERNLLALMAVAPIVQLERIAVQQAERKQQERSVELAEAQSARPAPAVAPPAHAPRVEAVQPAMPTFVPSYGFYCQPFPGTEQQQAAYYPPAAAVPGYYPAPFPFYFPSAQQQQQQQQQQQVPQVFAPSPYMYYPPSAYEVDR